MSEDQRTPDTRAKYVPPAVDQTAFNCPHCGALAKQFWFSTHANGLNDNHTPHLISAEDVKTLTFDDIEEPKERHRLKKLIARLATGRPTLRSHSEYRNYDLDNVSLSRCYNCSEIAIWMHNTLLWPRFSRAPLPNPDVPDDVRADYEEASTILDLSPRGAAALLRLCVQKLCKHLGEKGNKIDDDIAALVAKGLDPRVQQALDVVRVIGNNAVHPGQIDLRDDRATAEKLFGLVNLIAELMISQPKHVRAMYEGLPEGARKAIEKRDKS